MKKNRGIEHIKSKYGRLFVLPWEIGIIVFFAYPLIQSIIYSFSKMVIVPGGVDVTFIGLSNYYKLLFVDSGYTGALKSDLVNFLYSVPIILFLSLVLAIVLNQKFRGRLFFRALYFLPVIIATGTVINLIYNTQDSDTQTFERVASEAFSSNMLSVDDIVKWLDINNNVGEYIINVIGRIFDLIWNCGIQIVLFLAGLQSIPASLYEASRVEGATKWEEFWFITFPMLSQVTLLVGVFTMVELITNERGVIVSWTYKLMMGGDYDYTSAMMWLYFLANGLMMGLIVFLYNRILMKRWES